MKFNDSELENREFIIEQEYNFKSINFKLYRGELIEIETKEILDMIVNKDVFYINNCKIIKVVEIIETYNNPLYYENANLINTTKNSSIFSVKLSLIPFMENCGIISGEFQGIIPIEILNDSLKEISENKKKEYILLINEISKCKY